MNTTTPVLLVLSIGVAGLMLSMSGFAGVWGAPVPQTQGAQEEVEDSASDLSPGEGPNEGPVNSGESSVIGLITNALSAITSIAGAILLLPVTLMEIGFPPFFAVPIGLLAQIIGGIGLLEFATNREWS